MSIKQDRIKYEKKLMSKKNVIGVMTARKIRSGIPTNDFGITCLVSKKDEMLDLKSKDFIPRYVGDTRTDVIEVGEVKALSLLDTPGEVDRKTKIRPTPMGTSGGHKDVTAGTNGELLYVNGNNLCIGTNNHVGANSNDAEVGDLYLQPGPVDGGKVPEDVIGYLFKFVPISFFNVPSECAISGAIVSVLNFCSKLLGRKTRLLNFYASNESNLVDAAAIMVKQDSTVLPDILDIGVPKGEVPAKMGMLVQKSGRTTEHTQDAEITSIDATINVNYGEFKMATFINQIIITQPGFSAGGDSGSLILDMYNNATGKLFAGNDKITVANHIYNYLNALNAKLVTE